jgi:hypothetical protein
VYLEMSDDAVLSEGSNKKFNLRNHASLDKEGKEIAGDKGRSWFPGYAINVETGERLNIIFGEDSRQYTNNGRDMKWNPTSRCRLLCRWWNRYFSKWRTSLYLRDGFILRNRLTTTIFTSLR